MTMTLSPRNQKTLITNQSTSSQIMTFSKAPLTNSNSFNESNIYKDRYNGTSLSMSTTSDSLNRTTRRAPVKTFSLTRGVPRTGSTDSVLPDYHNNNIRSFYSDHDEKMKSPQSAPRKPKRFQATDIGRGDVLPISSSLSYRDRSSSYDKASDYSTISHSSEHPRMGRSSTFTESISKAWNGTINGRRKDETLPLHSSQDHKYDDGRNGNSTPNNHVNSNKASLRSRRTRSIATDRDDISVEDCNTDRRAFSGRTGWLPWSSSASDPSIRNNFKGGKRRSVDSQEFLLPLRISSPVFTSSNGRRFRIMQYSKHLFQCNWIQILIILAAIGIIWHSYHRTQTIHSRLERFHDKESMSLLHLKTVEQQLVHLHENIVRLNDAANNVVDNNNSGQSHSTIIARKDTVDADLIRVQTQQLHQMEEELDHELHALQSKIQYVARSSIVTTYGEGPVQVVLELDFMDPEIRSLLPQGSNTNHNTISILLWYDVPHAAWTFLHQIRQGMWNNANFKLGKGSLSIDAVPNEEYRQKESDIDDNSSLKFIEKSKKTHEPWTVGLTQMEFGTGMFINLQDNSALRSHDVCVGKVIDGFDALQLLVDVSRNLEGNTKSVAIKSAYASHLTRGQQGVM